MDWHAVKSISQSMNKKDVQYEHRGQENQYSGANCVGNFYFRKFYVYCYKRNMSQLWVGFCAICKSHTHTYTQHTHTHMYIIKILVINKSTQDPFCFNS